MMRLALAFLASGALLTALCAAAVAHEWYPPDCCSGGDCVPIDGQRVRAMISGYVIDGVHIVPYGQERVSQDGRYHACFPKPDKLRCLFVPPPAM